MFSYIYNHIYINVLYKNAVKLSLKMSCSYPVYKARNLLAAIDYQMHKDRPMQNNKKGELR